jgi:hypothetical protein
VEDIMQGNQRQAVLWAYLAGLIDGEGSFVIQKTSVEKIAKSSRSKTPKYLAYFCIGMVEKAPLDLIQEVIGAGKVYEERVPNRRSIWRIRFAGRLTLMPFIRQLLPYLIVKKKQAEVVLNFCENWVTPGKKEHGYRDLVSDQELQRREEAYLLMRKLNAVGAAATTKSFSTRECEAIV